MQSPRLVVFVGLVASLVATLLLAGCGGSSSGSGPTPGGIPPTITAQPVSQSAKIGQTVTFSVSANGTSPTFQWYVVANGASAQIAGATSSTYTIPAVATTNAGGYAVVVANAYGSVTSFTANLTVVSGPLNNGSATVTVN